MNISFRSLGLFLVLIRCACLISVLLFTLTAEAAAPVKIGVLAFRPKPQTQIQWQPLAKALKQAIPGRDFVIEALTLHEMQVAVANSKVDFVLTNPGQYVYLSNRMGLSSPLATLANDDHGQSLVDFGGVIFCRANEAGINTIADIKGKSIAITGKDSLGGYQTQMYELNRAGIHLPQDVILVPTEMPHDNVIEAVLSGRADVGFVRSGVLESLQQEGMLDISRIKVLNTRPHSEFPQMVSTRLYPEWPFSSLRHVDENLARHVASALFLLEENTVATHELGIHGFVVPADYTLVAELLRELRLPPFEAAPAFNLHDVWIQYRWEIMSAWFALGIILILWFRLLVSKKNLDSQHRALLQQKQFLQVSEGKIHLLLDSTAEGIYGMDAEGKCTFVNAAFIQIMGYQDVNEVIGKPIHTLIHHSHADGTPYPFDQCRAHQAALINQKIHVDDEVFWRRDGSNFQVEYWAFPVVENGQLIGSVTTFFDITERKQAEQKLTNSLSLLNATLESTADAILVVDLNNRWALYNQNFIELWNITKEIVAAGDDAAALAYVLDQLEDAEAFINKVSELYATPQASSFDQFNLKNGTIIERFSIPQKVGGQVVGRVWSFRDITERKQAEEMLHKLSVAVEQSPTSVIIADLEGCIQYVNPKFSEITGFGALEVIGQNPRILQSGQTPKEIYLELWDKITHGEVWHGELVNKRKNGQVYWEDIHISPVKNTNNVVTHFVAIMVDISERKQGDAERDRLLKIIEESPDFIATSDMQAHLKYLNSAGAKMVGLPEDVDLSQLEIKDMHPEWATHLVLEKGIPTVFKQGYWQHETALLHRDGHETPVSQLLLLHRDEEGNPEYLSTIMRDISQIKMFERKILDNEQHLKNILNLSPIAVRIAATHGRKVVFYNPRYAELIKSANPLGDDPQKYYLHDKDYVDILDKLDQGHSVINQVVELSIPDGSVVWALASYMPVQYLGEKAVLGWFYDITERKLIEEQVKHLAFYDTLTNLPNRRLLNDRLSQSMSAGKRSGCYGALMFLDLDNFKPLNDIHGHQVGDLLLIEVADRLKGCIREIDTVARFGGDEFVVVLSELDADKSVSETQARLVAEKILNVLAEPYRLAIDKYSEAGRTIEHRCTTSIGVKIFIDHECSLDDILIRADAAMYQAKEAGRNLIRFYKEQVDSP